MHPAMGDRLRLLQHLYSEIEDPDERAQLLADPALEAEWHTLRATKQRLDERPTASPPAAVCADICARAEAASREQSTAGAPARQPAPRAAAEAARGPSRQAMAWTTGLALLLGLLVGTLVLTDRGADDVRVPEVADQRESSVGTYWGDDHASDLAFTSEVQDDLPDDLPAWDDGPEFQDLRYNVRVLNSRSPEQRWYSAPGPGRAGGSGLQTTSNDRP